MRQFLVVNCEFNRLFYLGYIGQKYDNPPPYAKVKEIWIDDFDYEPDCVEEYCAEY